MANIPSFTLNDGTKIPSLGMGCFMGAPGGGERVYRMCSEALKCGYRHLDTAAGYGLVIPFNRNEEEVGRAIRDSGIPRSELYVTTKLGYNRRLQCKPLKTYIYAYAGVGIIHRVKDAFEESLKKLDVSYIDLYLMHWPLATVDGKVMGPEEHPTYIETWKEMEQLLQTGTFLIEDATIKGLAQKVQCIPRANCYQLGRATWDYSHTKDSSHFRRRISQVLDSLHQQPNMHKSLLTYHHEGEPAGVWGWTYEQLGWNMVLGGVVPTA
ncbi:aldo/keto reductase [Mycena metata]|uniref:Aldo/keto reductase n=1 Tax=Mycena metata TaxID=1033252 RepID=A0AAD7KC98_9AGAR|nr:aldo/keto reductase [Mycena metata]